MIPIFFQNVKIIFLKFSCEHVYIIYFFTFLSITNKNEQLNNAPLKIGLDHKYIDFP